MKLMFSGLPQNGLTKYLSLICNLSDSKVIDVSSNLCANDHGKYMGRRLGEQRGDLRQKQHLGTFLSLT